MDSYLHEVYIRYSYQEGLTGSNLESSSLGLLLLVPWIGEEANCHSEVPNQNTQIANRAGSGREKKVANLTTIIVRQKASMTEFPSDHALPHFVSSPDFNMLQ